jgi:hypothetical protein
MHTMKTLPAFALAATLTLAGCAQYASVSETKPQFRPARAPIGALVSTERSFSVFGVTPPFVKNCTLSVGC